jgi:flagella basal body P-ring formation protein FlgA
MKCLDKPTIWLSKIILLLVLVLGSSVSAEEIKISAQGHSAQQEQADLNTNVFWLNLKSKLQKYLDTNLNKSLWQYEIIGPMSEMKNFVGNRPDAEVKFSRLNLESGIDRKTISAQAADGAPVTVMLSVLRYREVYMLKRNIAKGQEIGEDDFIKRKVATRQQDDKLFFDGSPIQKVATQNIAAWTPIKITMLRHEKLIQTGDMVRVINESNVIKLEFMCRALNSADIGETINIFCQDIQNKNRKATVIEAGVAKLL